MLVDRKLLGVLAAGAVIAGICLFRVQNNRPLDYQAQLQAATIFAPAPMFEGTDENNQLFRLSAYLGRHRIIVVFFDGSLGADRSPEIAGLRDRAGELARLDVKFVGISRAIPQENRAALKSLGELPGPLISDVEGTIHEQWQRTSPDGTAVPGLFLIDRKGTVAYQGGAPRSYASLEDLWKDLRS